MFSQKKNYCRIKKASIFCMAVGARFRFALIALMPFKAMITVV